MDNYEYLLKSISVGSSDIRDTPEMTNGYAVHLLDEIVSGMKGVKQLNNNYETNSYYMYVGKFPQTHVAIDNKSGTKRLFTIYSLEDYKKIKSKLSFI